MHNGPDSRETPSAPSTLASFWETHKPGALHYSVARLGPETIDGCPARGLLYIGGDPVSEEQIEEKYGGGKYVARVNKLVDSWESAFEFEISGDPKPVYPFRFYSHEADAVPGDPLHFESQEPKDEVQSDPEADELRRAVAQLVPGVITILNSIISNRQTPCTCDASDNESEEAQEPRVSADPYDATERLFAEQADAKDLETYHHSLSLGMSIGAALTAAGVSAMSHDLFWLVNRMARSFGQALKSKHANFPPYMAQMRRRPAPAVEWQTIFPEPSVPNPPPPPSDEQKPPVSIFGQEAGNFEKELRGLRDKVKNNKESHEDVVNIFDHFEELFGDYFKL